MSELADRIAALSPDARARLEAYLLQDTVGKTAGRGIPRVSTSPPHPLSFAQQRLWFLEQLEPESPLYNVHAAFRVQGALDVAALQTALDQVVARHEALRTTFAAPDGQPVQVVGPPRPVALAVVDLTTQPAAEREAACQRCLAAEIRRPFDLTRDLLLRALLVRLGAAEHVLLVAKHHIASDGWSTGVLWRELGLLYAAAAAGRPPALPALPIQYADYAVWQRQWLQGDVLAAQLAYWRARLAGAPASLELPTDRPRPAAQTIRGGHRTRTLPPALRAALEALGRQAGATLFMTLLAAFQTLLARYTGQEEIVVGSPIAGRTRVETEGLIGFFVNTLVLRTDLAGNPPFRELLGRVREGCLGAYAHQELPFEKLVEELQPARSLSQSPLFQVMFILQNAPRTPLALPGLTLTPFRIESGTAKFELSLAVTATEAGLETAAEYNADLFDAATIDRLLGHYQTLLEGIVAAPDRPIGALPLLTAAERHQLLVAWNATDTAYPRDRRIHELFEAQVARTPDAVALAWADRALTYGELNRRANQLAHYLRHLGVGPETLVGLCLERSPELVIGLLGILKAGGAYVPLDPSYPKDRLAFMLADSRAAVLLTQTGLLTHLPPHDARPVCLDTAALATYPATNLACAGHADHLAYVLYTSGSTGQPKGVMVSHRALCNHMHCMGATFPLTVEDAVLQKTPVSFDGSVWEFFAPLLAGARLVLARPDGHRDTAYLLQAIACYGITTLQLVPSQLRAFLDEPQLDSCACLRRVFCGGEALTIDLQERFFARLEADLHNLYGPTEGTMNTTWWTCRRVGHHPTVPIGRPIANTQVYVLDRHRQPVPVGVPGELYVSGTNLARGYLNRPELTAERFLPHPFSAEPGARVYRTGDLVRYRPDGTLEFLGRLDHQVKLRGFRIELGEIEAVLGQHPAVHAAVVDLRETRSGDRGLVAYVVPRPGAVARGKDLRQFLGEKLPEHMVPSAYHFVETLPVMPNGKVDRRALAVLELLPSEPAAPYLAPRTPVEERLARIWADLLRVERVGVDDSFFELGGHSLLAAQVVSRIRKHFGVDLPMRTVFETPTLGGVALAVVRALVERMDQGAAGSMDGAAGTTIHG
jgi:amino acid adenylation domain-containing protein